MKKTFASIRLGDLHPNPFKKNVNGGQLHPEGVAAIKESAQKSSFWEGWVVRKVGNKYEQAFGHHRTQAAIELMGKNHEVRVQVEDYSDAQMLQAMANENAGEKPPVMEQRDVVVTARTFILGHSEMCQWKFNPSGGGAGVKRSSEQLKADKEKAEKNHEHGSAPCISHFLGELNWERSRVIDLLEIADKLDDSVVEHVAKIGTTHPDRQKKISQQTAVVLTALEKPSQVAAAAVIKDAGISVPSAAVRKVVKQVAVQAIEDARPHQVRAVSKVVADVPVEVIDGIVEYVNKTSTEAARTKNVSRALKAAGVDLSQTKVKELVTAVQKPLADAQVVRVKAAVTKKVEELRKIEAESKLKDGNAVAAKITRALYSFPSVSDMETLIANRGLLQKDVRNSLLEALQDASKKLAEYSDRLEQPELKQLGA